MKTSRHLDWLSITIPSHQNWRQFIPFADLQLTGKGRHGYGQSWHDKRTGATIETASTRDDMGTHLTLSGDVLAIMREDLGAVDDAIIRRIQEYDGQCSRIDIAIDCYHAEFTPDMLNEAIMDGSAKLRARTWRYIDGHRNGIHGSTVDTGSSKSDRRFRFYDKRAEMRIKDGEAWVRLELQLRRLYAKATIGACVEHGVSATIGASVGSYLSWSHIDYQTAIATEDDFGMSLPRREGKRRTWLLSQVASALAAELHQEPAFRERFDLMVNYHLEKLAKASPGRRCDKIDGED